MAFDSLKRVIRRVREKDCHKGVTTPSPQSEAIADTPLLPASSKNKPKAQVTIANAGDQELTATSTHAAEQSRITDLISQETAPSGHTPSSGTLAAAIASPSLPGRLWTNAYEAIRRNDPTLAKAYETILQSELGEGSSLGKNDTGSEHTEIQHVQAEMVRLVNSGLKKTIKEAAVKEKIHEGIRIVSSVKDLVGNAVKYAPEAATAWAGVCLLLQVLENPTAETSALRTGVNYVISRMDWYWSLSNSLLENQSPSRAQDELEKRVVALYESFLSFQMKSVCSFFRSRLAVILRDVLKFDNWTDTLQSVKDAEEAVLQDIGHYTNVETLKTIQYSAQKAEDWHQDEQMQKCLRDLRLSDPRDDKERIEKTTGGLILDASNWILVHDDFQRLRHCDDVRLLWMKGDPGKGKTMLMIIIVNELEREPTSGTTALSYFFCQGTNKDLNSATAVLRGLVYLLAAKYPALTLHLRESYNAAGLKLFSDGNSFFALSKILKNMLQDKSVGRACLMVDALDECIADRDLLLELIVHYTAELPNVKWIVSSRNRPEIEQRLRVNSSGAKLSLEVSENAEQVFQAVKVYIDSKVSELQSLQDNQDLRYQVWDLLRQKANGTFLWVALVIKELHTTNSWDILEVVHQMPLTLESLYERMMEQINGLKRKNPEYCKGILSAASLAYRPLHLAELGVLSGLPKIISANSKDVRQLVSLCGSFLTVQDDGFVYFIHQSAKDYLSDKVAASRREAHRAMFERSLHALQQELKRDMYGLRYPGFSLDDFEPPDPDPLACIRYSAVHWIDHLCEAQYQDDVADDGLVHEFLQCNLLFWFEVLSLFRAIPYVILGLAKLRAFLRAATRSSSLQSLVTDANRFLLHSRLVIRNAPLQVYVSALLFAPTRSLTRKLFDGEKPDWVSQGPIVDEGWGSTITTLAGHDDWVKSVAFSPDGKLVASGSDDKTIKIWDAATGETQRTLAGHDDWINSVVFSPDGKLVASGSTDKTIKIWDAATGETQQTLAGHDDWVNSVAFSPDGKLVASGSGDKTIKIWDAATGETQRTLAGHNNYVKSVAFSPDGKLVASGSNDKTIKIWDATTGETQRTLAGHDDWINSVVFSPDGKLVASGSDDKTIKIWDAATGETQRTLAGHNDCVNLVAFSPDGKLVASGSDDKTIKIWDAATGETQRTLAGHDDYVKSVAFSPDGKLVASGSDYKTIKIWDAATGETQRTLAGHDDWVRLVAFSPDGKLVASGSTDKTIKIWDAATGETQQTLAGHDDWVNSVAFSPDGKLVASGSIDKTIKIWDAATGETQRTLAGHDDWVRLVAFSPDGKLVASGSDDKTIKIWDAATGETQRTLAGHDDWVRLVAFSPDGKLVASGSDDKTIKIWDAATGETQQTLAGHDDLVRSVAFSPDGKLVASGSDDETIKIWDVATGETRRTLAGHSGWHSSVVFDPINSNPITNYGHTDVIQVGADIDQDEIHVQPSPRQNRPRMFGVHPDCSWITWNGHNVICLPPEYQSAVSAVWLAAVPSTMWKVAIGCGSGRVILVCFSDAPPVPPSAALDIARAQKR